MIKRLLADTNVLLRFTYADESLHPGIVASLAQLMAQGCEILFTPQSLREFWNVSTRPTGANGFGRTIQETDHAAGLVESTFTLLHDTESMHHEWRRLVVQHEVKGVQVHDARLAAAALVANCRAVLTLNDPDFKRFGVHPLHPKDATTFGTNQT